MQYIADSPASLLDIATTVLKTHTEARFFALYGNMGSGKTTFIHAFLKTLGVEDALTSPTFSIVNTYLSSRRIPIYHFDFYRIQSEDEVYDIGYEEYFYSEGYCFVEWPEKISDLLPTEVVSIFIEEEKESSRRKIRVQ